MASADADRNLLFGILALQMDFISRDALIAAMQAWGLHRAKPLGQILLEQGALQDDTQALLEALVQKHLDLHDNEIQRSLASLSSIGSLRTELNVIADPELQATLAQVSCATHEGEALPAAQGSSQGTLSRAGQRFRILRPHRNRR
jgi:hypothetical protein